MNPATKRTAYLSTATGRTFLAGLLLFSSMILLADESERVRDPDPGLWSGIWASSDRQLVLLSRSDLQSHSVCPRLIDEQTQPFCRQFSSPMVNACGDGDQVVIVLANGDIHRVNNALIGIHGDFEPVHRSSGPSDLIEAWFPGENCNFEERLPPIVAVEATGRIWHFDGANWGQLSSNPVSQHLNQSTPINPKANGSN